MTAETLEDAIFRLDGAVTRAEAARHALGTRIADRAATPAQPDGPDAALVARHARLRAGTEAAIVRLDTLIGPVHP